MKVLTLAPEAIVCVMLAKNLVTLFYTISERSRSFAQKTGLAENNRSLATLCQLHNWLKIEFEWCYELRPTLTLYI